MASYRKKHFGPKFHSGVSTTLSSSPASSLLAVPSAASRVVGKLVQNTSEKNQLDRMSFVAVLFLEALWWSPSQHEELAKNPSIEDWSPWCSRQVKNPCSRAVTAESSWQVVKLPPRAPGSTLTRDENIHEKGR